MKKQRLFVILGVVLAIAACTSGTETPTPQSQANEIETVVATTMQAYTASPEGSVSTPAATPVSGTPVSFEYASFVIPEGLATSANGESMPSVSADSGAPWEAAPPHIRFTLAEYPLQGLFHEPTIHVFPAQEYAQANSAAAEQIDRLKNILAGSALLKETLPLVPWFNAAPLIAADMQKIPFQNGRGVRALTQYAQYAGPINNRELFYHFQGLTEDARYYIIAILPINAPILAEDENVESTVPEGGVPIPTVVGPNNVYYISVTQKLNALSPDSFTPSLDTLDAIIHSIRITNP